jgi:AraC-like DNA-binding protein
VDRYASFPPADLAPLVDRFWGWRSAPGEATRLAPHAPGVGAELIFHLGAPFPTAAGSLPVAHVLAMRTCLLEFGDARDLDFVAIRFRSGALRHVLAGPARDIPEGTPDATEIWGAGLVRLLERLGEASTFSDRVRFLAAWLRIERDRHSRPDAAVDRAIASLYSDPADSRIDTVARTVGLGPRQLERRFDAAVGLGPKRFERLARAYKLVRAQALEPGQPYLPRALDLGYYDQAHAIHDLRELTGMAPTALFGELAAGSHFYNLSAPSRP